MLDHLRTWWTAVGRLDAWLGRTANRWRWVGHLAIVWIGVHYAADRVDDTLSAAFAQLPWPQPDLPLVLGTWCAIALELYVDGWAAWSWARATDPPITTVAAWRERATPAAPTAALLWLTAGVAGAWVVGMAVEDLVGSRWMAYGIGATLLWRLVWPALVRVVTRPAPLVRLPAAATAAALGPVLLVALLAVRYGWPVWGIVP